MIISALLLLLSALALIVGGLAWSRRLPGNSVIGLKVKEVRTSREIWDAAHAAAGPLWVLAGAILGFTGLLTLRIDGALSWTLAALAGIIALVLAGAGANLGAKVATAVAAECEDEGCSSGSCNCGSAPAAPEVDVAALRAAMRNADVE
ncbi:SdpI family protein [Corynebacterium epidermidicanis]|uniref:SdpI/YhfL protein family n=1 Tax=Corynebacterium epidermidicanis TaxID=1050174 RepID=A0A0G3GUX8_9CORY|nr:SdpI family protein [Corynebacterium epidermidicanis]AKK04325.1 SdpI/YhfL protein family [Corynebacterium epidermidicanis]